MTRHHFRKHNPFHQEQLWKQNIPSEMDYQVTTCAKQVTNWECISVVISNWGEISVEKGLIMGRFPSNILELSVQGWKENRL